MIPIHIINHRYLFAVCQNLGSWDNQGGLLITFISVYNECKALVIQISECAADIESSNIKLNRVATEISSLLHKYSIHESDVFNAIVSGNSNIKMLGIKSVT